MNIARNGNMYQKSLIQQLMEFNTALNTFKYHLNNLLENYRVQANVFRYTNSGVQEVTSGYFVIEAEANNLQDAIREVKDLNKCIRIVENEKFQVGTVYGKYYSINLNENEKVIDIETQSEVSK